MRLTVCQDLSQHWGRSAGSQMGGGRHSGVRLAAPCLRTAMCASMCSHVHTRTCMGSPGPLPPPPVCSRGPASLGHRSLKSLQRWTVSAPSLGPWFSPACIFLLFPESYLPRQDSPRAGSSVGSVCCLSARASGGRDRAAQGPCIPARSSGAFVSWSRCKLATAPASAVCWCSGTSRTFGWFGGTPGRSASLQGWLKICCVCPWPKQRPSLSPGTQPCPLWTEAAEVLSDPVFSLFLQELPGLVFDNW